ncbi:hypothetical protein LCGC14_1877240 [marine sediment metagenome]|uniref:H-type lectin domain-containing protein n=1 Tax=marine sediment metagenome TaxID=412755 RepID=A0A0F9G3B8_9ZZZZ
MGNVIKLPLVVSTAPRQVRGKIFGLDVGGSNGALTVSGDIISAVASIPSANQSAVDVTFATSAFTTPIIQFAIESAGNGNNDNDLEEPVFENLTGTTVRFFFHETISNVQNLNIHLVVTEQ